MRRALVCPLFVAALFYAPMGAEEAKSTCCEAAKAKLSAAHESVAGLLKAWQAAGEAGAKQCPEEAAAVKAELAQVAQQCPIGSRMGNTLAFIERSLAAAVEADEAAKAAWASVECDKAKAALAQLQPVLAARSALLKDLQALTKQALFVAPASPAACGEKAGEKSQGIQTSVGAKGECEKSKAVQTTAGFCSKKAVEIVAAVKGEKCEQRSAEIILEALPALKCQEKAAALATAIKGEACEKAAGEILIQAANACEKAAAGTKATSTAAAAGCCSESAGGCCSTKLAAAAKELAASWAAGQEQLLAMPAEARKELFIKADGAMAKCPSAKLMPQTFGALIQGLEALNEFDARIAEGIQAHAELNDAIPAKAHEAFQSECQALHGAHEVLQAAKKVLVSIH